MDIFTIGWIGWGAFFLILEGIAVFNKRKGDTLSEHVWEYIVNDVSRKGKKRKYVKTKRVMLLTLLSWVTVHFLTRGWM